MYKKLLLILLVLVFVPTVYASTIFYNSTGDFSTLTPLNITASNLNPTLTTTDYAQLTTAQYQEFTPANGTCVGIAVALRTSNNETNQYINITLQEKVGATWTDRVTKQITAHKLTSNSKIHDSAFVWQFFEFDTPYVVNDTAGIWRIKGIGTRFDMYWWETGATKTYAVVLNHTASYTPGDDILFRNDIVVTMDQNITADDLILGTNATLQLENPPSDNLTLLVTKFYSSSASTLQAGTLASPISNDNKVHINITEWDRPATYITYAGDSLVMYGEKPTGIHTFLDGDVAADSYNITTVDDMSSEWEVGDTIMLLGRTTNNNGYEQLVIQNISGTFVNFTSKLSTAHYDGWVAFDWSKKDDVGIELAINMDDAGSYQFELSGVFFTGPGQNYLRSTVYTSSSSPAGMTRYIDTVFVDSFERINLIESAATGITANSALKNIYGYSSDYLSDVLRLVGFTNLSLSDVYITTNSGSGIIKLEALKGADVTDLQVSGMSSTSASATLDVDEVCSGVTLTNIKSISSTSLGYALEMDCTGCNIINSTFDRGNTAGVYITGGSTTFRNCEFGQDVANTIDFTPEADTINKYIIKNSSAITVSGMADALEGSYIRAHQFDMTENDHRSWWKYGEIYSVGDGLSDTTTHKGGSDNFAIRFEPTSSSNAIDWEFDIPTSDIKDQTMSVIMWVKINSSSYYAGTHQMPTLNIEYDDSTTASSSATETTDWQVVSVVFTPITEYGQITVTIDGYTDATDEDAYFYVDDIGVMYPPGVSVNLGGLNLWANALPIIPPIATVIAATDIWDVPVAQASGAGTFGGLMTEINTSAASGAGLTSDQNTTLYNILANQSTLATLIASDTLNYTTLTNYVWNTTSTNLTWTGLLLTLNDTIVILNETTFDINTTADSILDIQQKGYRVIMTDFGEVLASESYYGKLFVFDYNGVPMDLAATPNITIYDSTISTIVSEVAMTRNQQGIYYYNYSISASANDGVWESIIKANINGTDIQLQDYWEVETNPAEVTISVTDNTIPLIVCQIDITNEGTSAQEYQYRWWVTDVTTGQYADSDMIDGGTAAKLINNGDSWSVDKELSVTATGDYWCKAEVFYGTERSGASDAFTAVEEESGLFTPVVEPPLLTQIKELATKVSSYLFSGLGLIPLIFTLIILVILVALDKFKRYWVIGVLIATFLMMKPTTVFGYIYVLVMSSIIFFILLLLNKQIIKEREKRKMRY